MNKELEQFLQQKIEELKQKIKEISESIYGNDLVIESVKLEDEIVYHFNGTSERVLSLRANTNKGEFVVSKSYPMPSEDTDDD